MGDIVGSTENISFAGKPLTVTKFLGIPFAEPPIGAKRFSKPVRKAASKETLYADTMPPMCFQNLDYYNNLAHTNITPDELNESEDCLYLNIYLPGGQLNVTKKWSVMVWIHGGGFQFGAQTFYTGLAFAALNNVILVTLNYRLSVFGFLSSGDDALPGNYGLWDQRAGIQWVKDNIDSFGGDSGNITIFGESAGSTSVIYQALHMGNRGLFKRVIAESGTANVNLDQGRKESKTFIDFVTKLNCRKSVAAMTVNCLRNLPYRVFVNLTKFSDTFYPVFDGDFIGTNPAVIFSNKSTTGRSILGLFGELDVIMGVNSAEGAADIDLVEQVMRSKNKDPAKGYSVDMFKDIVVPTVLLREGIKPIDLLTKAIVNQYVDWAAPTDKHKMRLRAVDFMSDVMFNADVIRTMDAHAKARTGGRLFFYVYDHQSSFLPDRWYSGANHAEEVSFVLGFPARYQNATNDVASHLPLPEVSLSKQIMKYWTNFAKTGDPNMRGDGPSPLTSWPPYTMDKQRYIRFRANVTRFPVEDHYAADRIHFWNKLVPVLVQSSKKTCTPYGNNTSMQPILIG